jgi:DNA polymerase theta
LGKISAKFPDRTGVVVCTIEKANALVQSMTENGTLGDSISAVIVDELHMVDDEDRGYLLELLLTKLKFGCAPSDPVENADGTSGANGTQAAAGLVTQMLGSAASTGHPQPSVQLIGMSATLPNVDLIGRWLDAAVFSTDFRPVRITAYTMYERWNVPGRRELVIVVLLAQRHSFELEGSHPLLQLPSGP